jgi:hypothetical protein
MPQAVVGTARRVNDIAASGDGMRVKGVLRFAMALAMALSASGLKADMAGAQAAYKRGMDKDKLKDYQGAMGEYQAALAAEPRYAYAWRQIGNDRYYLGDKTGALEAYDKYLAVVKNDPRTQAFADRLRSQLGATAAVAPVAPAAAAAGAEAGRPFSIGLDLGFHTVSFGAWNEDWKSYPITGDYPVIDSAYSVGLRTGYRLLPQLDLGLDLDYFLVGVNYTLSGGGASSTTKYDFSTLWVGPAVDWTFFTLANGSTANVGLGVGYMTLMGAGAKSTYSDGSSANADYSGSTVGFKGKLGFDYRFARILLGKMDLGYRLATIGKVDFKSSSSTGASGSGTLKRFGLSNAGASDLPLDYSGFMADLSLSVTF